MQPLYQSIGLSISLSITSSIYHSHSSRNSVYVLTSLPNSSEVLCCWKREGYHTACIVLKYFYRSISSLSRYHLSHLSLSLLQEQCLCFNFIAFLLRSSMLLEERHTAQVNGVEQRDSGEKRLFVSKIATRLNCMYTHTTNNNNAD